MTPFVLVMLKSTCADKVSESVALLLAGFGSVTAEPIAAVLESVPAAPADTVQVVV